MSVTGWNIYTVSFEFDMEAPDAQTAAQWAKNEFVNLAEYDQPIEASVMEILPADRLLKGEACPVTTVTLSTSR